MKRGFAAGVIAALLGGQVAVLAAEPTACIERPKVGRCLWVHGYLVPATADGFILVANSQNTFSYILIDPMPALYFRWLNAHGIGVDAYAFGDYELCPQPLTDDLKDAAKRLQDDLFAACLRSARNMRTARTAEECAISYCEAKPK